MVARITPIRSAYRWLRRKTRGSVKAAVPRGRIAGYELEAAASTLQLDRIGIGPDSRYRLPLIEGRYALPRFIDHVDHSPPGPAVTFLTVCTDVYAPGLEALLLSLLAVYPDLESPFIVVHDGRLSALNRDRLRGIYPRVEFRQRDPERYAIVALGETNNHKRIGLLGYLNLEALYLEEPEYVVVLDSDLLILGDVSPLWTGSRARAALDVGQWPFAEASPVSGKPVFNSGVISLPRSLRVPAMRKYADEILSQIATWQDPSIAEFVDQKFWNIFLWTNDAEVLPQNFNVNKSLVERYFTEEWPSVKVLHITGAKPWFELTKTLLPESSLPRAARSYRVARSQNRRTFTLWEQSYGEQILRSRLERFHAEEGARLDTLRGCASGRPTALIGNGPSINRTDLSAFDGYERVVFNWFPRLNHFDDLAPENLVIASHMLFGGWHHPDPKLPEEYLEMLASRRHKPRLWASYYFKPYLSSLPELEDYEKYYFLFEKPIKRFVHKTGHAQFDLKRPLADANTGVLTAGVPMALWFGSSTIVLAGCDSNYASSNESYFYPASQHASATTREESLVDTWRAGGAGQYGYAVTHRDLEQIGVQFLDATVDGALQMPKLSLNDARMLAAERPA